METQKNFLRRNWAGLLFPIFLNFDKKPENVAFKSKFGLKKKKKKKSWLIHDLIKNFYFKIFYEWKIWKNTNLSSICGFSFQKNMEKKIEMLKNKKNFPVSYQKKILVHCLSRNFRQKPFLSGLIINLVEINFLPRDLKNVKRASFTFPPLRLDYLFKKKKLEEEKNFCPKKFLIFFIKIGIIGPLYLENKNIYSETLNRSKIFEDKKIFEGIYMSGFFSKLSKRI